MKTYIKMQKLIFKQLHSVQKPIDHAPWMTQGPMISASARKPKAALTTK